MQTNIIFFKLLEVFKFKLSKKIPEDLNQISVLLLIPSKEFKGLDV
jgi:hypothetical protein